MRRRLFTALAGLSAVLCGAMVALWLQTEVLRYTDTIVWGPPGVYRSVEFSGDDMKYKVLRDPGGPPTGTAWGASRMGRLRPPPPVRPAAVPRTSVTWGLPQPNGMFTPTGYGGVARVGVEWADFAGWYGPGTSLYSLRVSYFVVMLPAALLPLAWAGRAAARRWRHGRFGPGYCRRCGYDLRASPGRCPECGAVPKGAE